MRPSRHFHRNYNQRLGFRLPPAPARVHAPHIGLVHFDPAGEAIAARTHHRPTKLVEPRPGGLVAAQTQRPLQPQGAHPRLLVRHPPHRSEPRHQRRPRVLEDRAGGGLVGRALRRRTGHASAPHSCSRYDRPLRSRIAARTPRDPADNPPRGRTLYGGYLSQASNGLYPSFPNGVSNPVFPGSIERSPVQVGGFDVNIVIHRSTQSRTRRSSSRRMAPLPGSHLGPHGRALWKLTAPWTHRTRPPRWKTAAFSTSFHRAFPIKSPTKNTERPQNSVGKPVDPKIKSLHHQWSRIDPEKGGDRTSAQSAGQETRRSSHVTSR